MGKKDIALEDYLSDRRRYADLIDFGEDAKLADRLRMLFALYARRNDRDSFKEYLDTHKACRNMDDETCQTLGMLTGSAR